MVRFLFMKILNNTWMIINGRLKDYFGRILNRKETKDLMPMVTEIVELIIKNLGEPTPEEKRQMEMNSNTGNASETDREGTIKRKSINALKAGKGWQEGIEMSHSVAMVNEICDLSTFIGKKLRTILKRNNAMDLAKKFKCQVYYKDGVPAYGA